MKQGSGGSASADPMVTLPTVNAARRSRADASTLVVIRIASLLPSAERIMARIAVRSGEINRPPDTEPSNAAVPSDAEAMKAEGVATWKPPTLPRKLPPDPVLALKDRAKAVRREAEKMREAAIKP